MGQSWPLFVYFVIYKHKFYRQYCSLQRDLNLDCRSRRWAHWPLDHHHGPKINNSFTLSLSLSLTHTHTHTHSHTHPHTHFVSHCLTASVLSVWNFYFLYFNSLSLFLKHLLFKSKVIISDWNITTYYKLSDAVRKYA